MSKTTKTAKNSKAKAKRVTKKPAVAHAKTKKQAKAPAKKVAKSVEPVAKKGFMWKLLENKEKQQKEQQQKNAANPFARNEEGFKPNARGSAFSKFAGPRRRAG